MVQNSKRWENWSWRLVLLLLGGAFFRFFLLGRQSLWVDEMHTLGSSGINPPLIYPYVFEILQGPFHALLLFYWHQLAGVSELAIRFPSAIAGVVSVFFFYKLALKLLDPESAFWAAAVFAFSPYAVWYSQEARNYVFLILFTVLSFHFFLQLLEGRRVWVEYGVFTYLCVMSNLSGFFVIVVQGVIFLLAGRKSIRRLPWLLLTYLAILAAFSPWVWHMFRQMELERLLPSSTDAAHELLRGRTTFSPLGIPYTFFAFSVGYSLGPSPREIGFRGDLSSLSGHWWEVALGAAVFGVVALRGLVGLKRRSLVGLLVWFGVPFAVTSYFAIKNFKPFNARYCTPAFPAYELLLGRGIGTWKNSRTRLAVASLLFLVTGYSLGNYYFNPDYEKDDFRSASRYLEAHENPGDALIALGNFRPLDYYYHGSLRYRVVWEYEFNRERRLEEMAARMAREHDRLWVVSSREWLTDRRGVLPHLLGKHFELRSKRSWPGVKVSLYVRRDGAGGSSGRRAGAEGGGGRVSSGVKAEPGARS